MSLIDEALKRAQAAHGTEGRTVTLRPWTPAPLPDRGRTRRRKILRGAAIAAALLALAISGLVWVRLAPATKLPVPAREHGSERRPTAILPTPLPLEEVRVDPPPRAVAAAPSGVRNAEEPAPQTPQQARPQGPAPAPAHAASHPPGGLVSGKTYVGSVVLPGGGRIDLEGIVYSESNATAVVNGRIVVAGDYVEGFTVARIEENRLELSGSGLTIYLALR